MSEENQAGAEEGQVGGEESQAQLEAEASEYGWRPKEEFKGRESDWVDAETFVKRGKEINPILKKNNERLLKELQKARADVDELRLTVNEFGSQYKKMQETAYTRAMAEVKEQLREARRDDNSELEDQLSEQLDTLKAEKAALSSKVEAPKVSKEEAERVVSVWSQENTWYNAKENPALVEVADGVALKLAQARPDLLGKREFLDIVTERVKELVPEKFKNPRRDSGSPVSGSSESRSGSRTGGKKGYNDLPPEAKAACDRFVKNIPGYKAEDYIKEYFSN